MVMVWFPVYPCMYGYGSSIFWIIQTLVSRVCIFCCGLRKEMILHIITKQRGSKWCKPWKKPSSKYTPRWSHPVGKPDFGSSDPVLQRDAPVMFLLIGTNQPFPESVEFEGSHSPLKHALQGLGERNVTFKKSVSRDISWYLTCTLLGMRLVQLASGPQCGLTQTCFGNWGTDPPFPCAFFVVSEYRYGVLGTPVSCGSSKRLQVPNRQVVIHFLHKDDTVVRRIWFKCFPKTLRQGITSLESSNKKKVHSDNKDFTWLEIPNSVLPPEWRYATLYLCYSNRVGRLPWRILWPMWKRSANIVKWIRPWW